MVETELIDGCPCGLQGENCDVLVPPLGDVAGAAAEPCDLEGFDFCDVKANKAVCVCECGSEGEFCEAGVIPIAANFVFAWVFVFGLVAAALIVLNKYSAKRKESGVLDLTKSNFVTSRFEWIKPWMLMVYRAVISIFFIVNVVFIFSFSTREFIFFTQWSFTLFGFTYLIATVISIRHFFNPENYNEPMGLLEYLHQALFTLSMPVALLVTLIFWILLAPEEEPEVVYNGRSISAHGIHFVLISIEFFISRIWFRFENFAFIWIHLSAWISFHSAYQQVFFLRGEGHCPLYGFADMSNPLHLVLLFAFVIMFTGGYYGYYRLSQRFKRNDEPVESEKEEK